MLQPQKSALSKTHKNRCKDFTVNLPLIFVHISRNFNFSLLNLQSIFFESISLKFQL